MKNLKFKSMVYMASFLLLAMVSLNLPISAKTTITPNSLEAKRGRERSIIVTPDVDFRIDVWANQLNYYIGEDIRIYFHSNFDCYVYIFDVDTNGNSRQIFPNYFDRENLIRGGHTYSIPDYGYRLEVTGPSGREYIRAVAIREHYPFLRNFEKFNRSDPFPRPRGGFEAFKQQLESGIVEKEYYANDNRERLDDNTPRKLRDAEQKRDVQEYKQESLKFLEIIPKPVPPRPPYRYYAESYTSLYVRARWYDDRDFYRQPLRQKKLQFSSIPDDAELYIDGRHIGKTSQKLYLSYGSHLVRFRKRGYSDWVRYIFVDDETPYRVVGDLRKHTNEHFQPYNPEWDRYYRGEREEWGKPDSREPGKEKSLEAPRREGEIRRESPYPRNFNDERSRIERRLRETEAREPDEDR